MKNYVAKGDTLTLTAPYGVASGAGMKLGAIFGVAMAAAITGAMVTIQRIGIFDLPKAAVTIVAGDKAYWDDTAKLVTNVVSTNLLIGVFTDAAASGVAVGRVYADGTTR